MKKTTLYFCLVLILLSNLFGFNRIKILKEQDKNSIMNTESLKFSNEIEKKKNYKKLKYFKNNLELVPQIGDILILNLFNEFAELEIHNTFRYDSTSISFSGKSEYYSFSITKRNSNLSGKIIFNNKSFSIIPISDGNHVLIEIDPSKYKESAPPVIINNTEPLNKKAQSTTSSTDVIDVLVAYTPNAASAVSDIVGLIQNAISSINTSFSGEVDLEYYLVKTVEYNYTEGQKDMSTVLSDFSTDTDIINLVKEYNADLYYLVTNGSAISGMGQCPSWPNRYGSAAIGNYDYVRDSDTYAHECGHNMTLKHNIEEDPSGNYEHGYLSQDETWCTIMAYPVYGVTQTELNLWSNPNENWGNSPRGNSNTADCIRRIGEIKYALSRIAYPKLAGTLTENQTLVGRNYKLTDDLVISNSATLKIESGATLDLNEHTITLNGGYIVINGTVEPEIKLQTGSTLNGFYPSISSAIAASSSSQSVHAKGNFSFNDNFSIPSGKILYIESSSQLQFAASKYLSVTGTLNASNTTFTSSADSWWGIKYYSTSSGSMTNCTINNATCGTWISGSSPTIQSNTYSNCERGIYIRESTATPSIESNTISNCSIQGIGILNASPSIISNEVSNSQIYLNNSNANFQNNYFNDADANSVVYIYGGSPTFFDNTITADDAMLAVNAVNGSDPWFGDDFNEDIRWKGFNILSATGDWNDGAIWADGGSTPELGYGYAGPYWCGYNSILSNSTTGYPAAAFGTSSINAAWCWWGSSSVPTNYGAVITNDEFQQPIGGGSSLAKISTPNTIIENDLSEEEILWISATKYYYKAEYNDCICILKNIINDYPESKYAFKSINLISRISRKHNKCNETEIYDEMLSSLKSSKLKTTIKSKNIQDYRMKGDYKKSIKICNEIISDNPESLNKCYALFDLFNIYYKDLNDTVSAISMLNELKLKYPDNEVTTIARKDVGEKLNYERLSKKSQKLIDISDAPISSEFTLFDNYPNPFNPTTTISYNLPQQANVCIKIYDIKGNLVKTLVNERSKPQGHYTVNWNASDMSSGVYFYQIKSGNNIQMKKCLLVK